MMTIKEKSVLRKMKAKHMLRMTMNDDCVWDDDDCGLNVFGMTRRR